MTHKQYLKKLADSVAFEKEYLITCIEAGRDYEVIEYCQRLAQDLNEYEVLKEIESKYSK